MCNNMGKIRDKISLTKFEWVLLIGSNLIILLFYIFAPRFHVERNTLSLISSVVGIFGIILMAKGIVAAHVIYIIFSILYSILSYKERYYGEVIIYCCLMIPFHILSLIFWTRSKIKGYEQAVKVEGINKKSFIIFMAVAVLSIIPFYYILKRLNTDNLIVSTASITMNSLAAVLMLKRHYTYALCFVIDDALLIFLWGLKLAESGISLLPTMVNTIVFFLNDIYAFIKWAKRYKRQKENKIKDAERMG